MNFFYFSFLLPSPVHIQVPSYVALPVFRRLRIIMVRVLELQPETNWLILGVYIIVLLFDFFLAGRWLPRAEHSLPVLKHVLLEVRYYFTFAHSLYIHTHFAGPNTF